MVHIDDDWGRFSGAAEEIAPKILENLRKGFKIYFYFVKLSLENISPGLH